MQADIVIRPAQPTDAEVMSALLGELGYPSTPSQVAARLARLQAQGGAVAWVASVAGAVCGLATVHTYAGLNRDDVASQLTLLVVAAAARGSGAGTALVRAAQQWSAQRGSQRLVVSTALHRAGAHAFYERLGYALSGRRYALDLC